jgi:hypothetical protein
LPKFMILLFYFRYHLRGILRGMFYHLPHNTLHLTLTSTSGQVYSFEMLLRNLNLSYQILTLDLPSGGLTLWCGENPWYV